MQRYKVTGVADFAKDMEEKGLGKPKVSLQFELSSSGMTSLIKAEAVVEETYTVEEEVEIEDDEEESGEEDTKEEEKAPEGTERKTQETAEAEEEKDEESAEEKTDEADGDDKNKTEGDDAEAEEGEEEKPKKKTELVEKVCQIFMSNFYVSGVFEYFDWIDSAFANCLDFWHSN